MNDQATRYGRNTVSFVYAIAVHGVIAAVLLFSFSWKVLPGAERGHDTTQIVQARVVNEVDVERELAKLKDRETAKQQRELEQRERLDQLLKKANDAEQRRKREEADLKKLKDKQATEKKRTIALEKKRKAEEQRIADLEKKRKKQAALDKKRKQKKAAERKRKQKLAADKKRKKERQRQRELQEQLAQEQLQRRARNALELYIPVIRQHVQRNWNRPPNITQGMSAKVRVRLSPNGDVQDVRVVVSSGDPVFDRSVEYAVYKSTPLPLPEDPAVAEFLRREQIQFAFSPS